MKSASALQAGWAIAAFDGLAVVVNPQNDWCDCIMVEQLKSIWRPKSDGTFTKWSDVNPDWPDEELKLYGPGTDSGTFGYFTEAICGEARASRRCRAFDGTRR